MISLSEDFTLFLLNFASKAAAFICKSIGRSCIILRTHLCELVSHEKSFTLKSLILAFEHVFVVRIRVH